MAEPVHEMARECASLLLMAADRGEPISEAALRDELGVGHDDLRAILDQLREAGRATEVLPGEWSGPDAEPEPVRVSVSEEEPAEMPEAVAEALRRRDGRAGGEAGSAVGDRVMSSLMPEPHVRLTASIADALSDEALGQLVKAGLADCEGTFLMEIGP